MARFWGQNVMGQVLSESFSRYFRPLSFPFWQNLILGPILSVFLEQDLFVYFGYVIAILSGIYLYNSLGLKPAGCW